MSKEQEFAQFLDSVFGTNTASNFGGSSSGGSSADAEQVMINLLERMGINVDPNKWQDVVNHFNSYTGSVNGVDLFSDKMGYDNNAILSILTQWAQGLNGENLREAQSNILNFLSTLNERDYNKSLLQDERSYASPGAQLARLMQTGLSRGAALEMINSQATGSAIGASTAQPFTANAKQEATDLARQDSIMNGVLSAASTFAGIASMGISAPAAIATNSIQAAAAKAAERNTRAQELSGQFNANLYRASRLGLIDPSKTTYDQALPIMQDITKEQSPEIYDFMHGGEFDEMNGLPGGYKIFSENYNARFGNINSLEQARQMRAATTAANLKPKVIQQEILRSQAQITKIFAEIENIEASTVSIVENTATNVAMRDLQLQNLSSQNELSRVQIDRAKSEAEMVRIAAHRAQITADDLDATVLARCSADLAEAQTRNSDEFKKMVCEGILENEKARRAFIAFNYLRKTNLAELAANNPQLLEFHNLCEEMNLAPFMEEIITKNPIFKGKGQQMVDLLRSFGRNVNGIGNTPTGFVNPLLGL